MKSPPSKFHRFNPYKSDLASHDALHKDIPFAYTTPHTPGGADRWIILDWFPAVSVSSPF